MRDCNRRETTGKLAVTLRDLPKVDDRLRLDKFEERDETRLARLRFVLCRLSILLTHVVCPRATSNDVSDVVGESQDKGILRERLKCITWIEWGKGWILHFCEHLL